MGGGAWMVVLMVTGLFGSVGGTEWQETRMEGSAGFRKAKQSWRSIKGRVG